ncbi:MAG: metal ABC transporter substrate-binding protein [Candidatus Sumerlaeia bacterium]|nr:metal ABC transporter substrate-binding protein [Candidatus Sumerlaeia bacterium]
MRMSYRLSRLLLLLLCLLPAALPAGPLYVATIEPLGSVLREMVAGRGRVEVLLAPGQSPHVFDPRPSHARRLAAATAFFYAADSVEPWAERLNAKHSIELLGFLPEPFRLPLSGAACEHGQDQDHGHAHAHDHGHDSEWDGHWWLDPLAVEALLPPLAERLAELDPEGAAVYRANAARYGAQLQLLDAELSAILAPVAGREVVTQHAAFGYLLHRYGLKDGGVMALVAGQEPTPGHLRELAEGLKARGVRAVFTEPQLSARPAQVLAEVAGIPVHELDPEGARPGRASLAELLRYNANTLAEALADPKPE